MELENFWVWHQVHSRPEVVPLMPELSSEWCKNKAVDYCKPMNVVVVKKIERDIAIV